MTIFIRGKGYDYFVYGVISAIVGSILSLRMLIKAYEMRYNVVVTRIGYYRNNRKADV